MKKLFFKGVRDGIPIFLGYLSVSFGFGILCINLGLSVATAVGISITNLTSAGQVAGVGIIAAGGTLIEMVLTQIVINLRYSLFAIALSQKLDSSFTTPHRVLASFGITDEIFAVSYAQEGKVKPIYMYGLILVSTSGWVLGTLLGAVLGQVLPASVSAAMGIMLYGMFIAVVVPDAKDDKHILAVSGIAVLCSCLMYYLPMLKTVSSGFAVIICTVIAATLGAWFFPREEATQDAV